MWTQHNFNYPNTNYFLSHNLFIGNINIYLRAQIITCVGDGNAAIFSNLRITTPLVEIFLFNQSESQSIQEKNSTNLIHKNLNETKNPKTIQ